MPKLPNGFTPSQVQSAATATQSSGEVDIAALTADGQDVEYYWALPGKAFQGPVIVGPSDALVKPAMVVRATGEVDIVTVYQNHLEYYWNFPGSAFFGPVQIGTDTFTDGYPQLLARNVNEVDVAAISTNNQVEYFWDFPGHLFSGPAIVQSNAYPGVNHSGLTMDIRPNGELDILTNTAPVPHDTTLSDNTLTYFFDFVGQPFQGPVTVATGVDGGSQGMVIRPSGEADIAFQTVNPSVQFTMYSSTDQPGRPFSSPAVIAQNELVDDLIVRPNGEADLASEVFTGGDFQWVQYRWSFPGTSYQGPVTALPGADVGNELTSYLSMAVGSSGIVQAADCYPDQFGLDEVAYTTDAPGQQFAEPGFVGPGCYPTVVVRS